MMIAATYALAFLASMLVMTGFLSYEIGLDWEIKYVTTPSLPYIALIG